jgi:dihydroneopterin aldolase
MKNIPGTRILSLSGFKFNANLGILEHERNASQPIEVTAELNMGHQPARPSEDQLHAVLDYRKVHAVIIEECIQVHVNMLESLTGKLCERLMQFPGVIGVQVKIVKLEIFPDCVVSIQQRTGVWPQ